MGFIKPVLISSLIFGVVACSGPNPKPKAPKLTEHFTTQITENGSKMFDYSLVAQRPDGDRKGRGDGAGRRGPGGKNGEGGRRGGRGGAEEMQEHIKREFYQKLQAKLEETGYCREGYMELDSEFSRRQSRVRGECRESSTDSDREKFGAVQTTVSENMKQFSPYEPETSH